MDKLFKLLLGFGVRRGAASVGKTAIDANSRRLIQQILSKDGAVTMAKALGLTAAEQMSSEVIEAFLFEVVEHILLVDDATLADALMACITESGDIAVDRIIPDLSNVDKGEALAATLTVVLAILGMNAEDAKVLKDSMDAKGVKLGNVTYGGQTLLATKVGKAGGITVYDATGKQGIPAKMSTNKRAALFFTIYMLVSVSWSVYDHYETVKSDLATGVLPASADRVERRAPGSSMAAIERESARVLEDETKRVQAQASRAATRVAGPPQGDVPVLPPKPGRYTFTGGGTSRPDFAELSRRSDNDGVLRIIELDGIPEARDALLSGDRDYLLDAAQERVARDIGVSPESVGRFAALVASVIRAQEKRG